MNWRNVSLILSREVRDQLRDRRTLFMIFVLPVLLYPLLGMSMFQIAQFVREQPVKVLLLGEASLPKEPPLIVDGQFSLQWFIAAEKADLIELSHDETDPDSNSTQERASKLVTSGEYDAVVVVPADFAQQLAAFRESIKHVSATPRKNSASPEVPSPQVYFNTAKEKSQIAFFRVSQVLNNWKEDIGRSNLESTHLPATAAQPFAVSEHDLAHDDQRKAVMWSKILPFMLLIWALTGAFYPAVDLCAGEKERGTLETLLSSPALRSEVVWGKLLTIILFSAATAVLNIASIAVTGAAVSTQLPDLGPPPASAPLWLAVALVPMSCMFSALCLALASFARSTKEGQYYLMPLVLVTLPLVMLPMAPGVELTLGNSLIPITGVVLLLRSMLEGEYLAALPYIAPVTAITILSCWLAMRWAIDQFSSENVLFRESERFDMGLWVRHLLRDREDTPNVAAAFFCGVMILVLRFFMGLVIPQPQSFDMLARTTLVLHIAVVATPALLMTVMLTRNIQQTLLLRRPPLATVPAVVLLALFVSPVVQLLSHYVNQLYPIDKRLAETFGHLLDGAPLGWLLLVLAVSPAICEEVAYRGFILSGLRHLGSKWRAILFSSVLFGITHSVLQQSILASLTGILIGYIAVQTGSLLPGIVYHLAHNSLPLLMSKLDSTTIEHYPWLALLGEQTSGGFIYHTSTSIIGAGAAILVLLWFRSLPYKRTAEESLREAIEHGAAQLPV